ncbi:cytochrome P450 family protein [Mycobacterium kansasii]|uniref:Cytochrome P450 family protein n=1 Tax=Mycobacterium kansasii TaxID=1768 RepID=A0A1V3WN51_MYCKA|nr:cytochrome P450 family protein [Mycobacterium kansasii]
MRPFMEKSTHWFLDQHSADGHMDLVLDYASPVPAILTMRLMGLPYDNWHLYANLFHSVMAVPQDSPEYANALAAAPAMMHDVLEFAANRRADPHDDLTSFLIQFEFDGQRLSDEQLLNIIWNLIAGGVDTTTSQTALTLLHLGTHPQLRRQLIDHPELYRTATDEFLRYFSVNQQLSRTVTRDVTVGGQQLHRNDRVVISWLAANHDEREFDQPEAIVLDRTPNRHLAFGLGPHRCIGSHLARLMAEVMVKAVLDRIPDYRVDLDGVHQYLGNPSMTGLGKLPVVFTPHRAWAPDARGNRLPANGSRAEAETFGGCAVKNGPRPPRTLRAAARQVDADSLRARCRRRRTALASGRPAGTASRIAHPAPGIRRHSCCCRPGVHGRGANGGTGARRSPTAAGRS